MPCHRERSRATRLQGRRIRGAAKKQKNGKPKLTTSSILRGSESAQFFFPLLVAASFPRPTASSKLSLSLSSLSLSLSLSRRTSKVSATPLFFSASLSPSSPRRRRASALLEGNFLLPPPHSFSPSTPPPLNSFTHPQAWRGDVQAIEALLAAGATVDLPDSESGW